MEKQQANGVRKGAWTKEEDILLTKCIHKFGQGRWHLVPLRAGLNRCRKSCRLRWLNYLNPNVKRGFFTQDEVDLIMRMHKLLGNRWSLIAGRIPGRTANDIKNFWNTHIHKKTTLPECCNNNINVVIRPQPQKVSPRLLHHQPSPSELIIMTPSKTNQLAAEENDFPSNLITENEIPTNTQQPLDDDDQLVPDDEVGESMSWWAKLINTCTENDNGARSVVPFSFFEDNDHQPMILSQGSGDQANVKHLSTSIDDCGYDLDAMWELMNMDKY